MCKNHVTSQQLWRVPSALLLLFAVFALPVQSQVPNLSNGTSTVVTTSDAAGGAFAENLEVAHKAKFTSETVQAHVNEVAASLNMKLAQGTLLLTSFASADKIVHPVPAAQQILSCVFSSDPVEEMSACQEQTEVALATIDGHTVLARGLVQSLEGLTAGDAVAAHRLVAAHSAFNAFVEDASAEYLIDPPEEFTVIYTVLSTLVEAATSAN